MEKDSQQKKPKLEPIKSTLVVHWTKPEDDPIRHAAFVRDLRELIDGFRARKQKDAA